MVKLTREYFEVTADVRGKDTLMGGTRGCGTSK